MAARVFVVGVGYTGRRLLAKLTNPVGVSRSDKADLKVPAVRLDLDSPDPARLDVRAADSLVYTVPPSRDVDNDVRLERLLDGLQTAPARIVYLSTSGVYGNHDGRTVSEETPMAPATDRAKRRAAAEGSLTDWCARHGSALVVLRVPGIYGPGRLGTERLAEGTTVIRESETGPGNRIHVDDLAACILSALEPTVPAGVYNVGDGDYRSSTWFLNEVARQAGLPAPASVSRDEALRTFSPMRLSFLSESRRVDIGRMRELMQPDLAYPDAATGIAAALAEERA